jgi:hypothetical protein
MPRAAWTVNLLIMLTVAGMIGMYHHASFYWLRWGLAKCLPGLALNHDPPDLRLLSSKDYSYEPCVWPFLDRVLLYSPGWP